MNVMPEKRFACSVKCDECSHKQDIQDVDLLHPRYYWCQRCKAFVRGRLFALRLEALCPDCSGLLRLADATDFVRCPYCRRGKISVTGGAICRIEASVPDLTPKPGDLVHCCMITPDTEAERREAELLKRLGIDNVGPLTLLEPRIFLANVPFGSTLTPVFEDDEILHRFDDMRTAECLVIAVESGSSFFDEKRIHLGFSKNLTPSDLGFKD